LYLTLSIKIPCPIKILKQDALDYHTKGQPGKMESHTNQELSTQLDLALAYSPGVAEPCKEIAANKEDVYKYTSKEIWLL